MFKGRISSKTFVTAVRLFTESSGGGGVGGVNAGPGAGVGAGIDLKGAKSVLTGERGINKVTLLGRVGQDSVVRGNTENTVTVFPLATSYSLKTRDGQYVQRTEWHRITVLRPVLKDLAAQFVKKGDRVYVTGMISYSQYKDKNDQPQRATSIIADDVINMTRPMHGVGAIETEGHDVVDQEGMEAARK